MNVSVRQWFCLILPVWIAGCEPRNLYVAHDSVVGLNAQVSPDRQQGQLIVGYDRDFVVVIPKSVEKGGGTNKRDAMSLLNCTHLEVDGLFLTEYADSVASGEAAVKLAGRLTKDDSFFDCALFEAADKNGGTGEGIEP